MAFAPVQTNQESEGYPVALDEKTIYEQSGRSLPILTFKAIVPSSSRIRPIGTRLKFAAKKLSKRVMVDFLTNNKAGD